jgi:hypothetical protein
MSDNHQPSFPFGFQVSAEDVARWRVQAEELRERAAILLAESAHLVKRVEVAETLFKLMDTRVTGDAPRVTLTPACVQASHIEPTALPTPPDRLKDRDVADEDGEFTMAAGEGRRATYIAVVEAGVNAAPMGIAPFELKAKLFDSSFGERLRESDKGFYRAIDRLAEKDRIFRSNGRLFSRDALNRYRKAVDAGEIQDIPARYQNRSPMGDAIQEIVRATPGIKALDIIAKLRVDAEFKAALDPRATGAFNILARLVKRRQITKTGRQYFPSVAAATTAGDGTTNGGSDSSEPRELETPIGEEIAG